MGRIQKLREQKKLKQLQTQEAKSAKAKKIITGVIIGVAALILIGFGANAIFNNKKNPDSVQSATPSPSSQPNSLFPSLSPSVALDLTKKNVVIETGRGDIILQLYPDSAPKTVDNFVKLISNGFYNGLKFHRVVPGFVIQGGDPKGDGTGGPGYTFEDEINPWSLGLSDATIKSLEAKGYKFTHELTSHKIVVGTLAMANAGPNTNGSQFFIVTEKDQPTLDGQYTAFGQVIQGQDVVQKIQPGDIIKKVYLVDTSSLKTPKSGPAIEYE